MAGIKLIAILVALISGVGMSQASSRDGSIALGMVALPEYRVPDAKAIICYVQSHWPDARTFGEVEEKDGIIFFTGHEGEVAFISYMNAPIPWGDIDFPCKTAYHWPDACDAFRRSTAHAVVSVVPAGNDSIDSHKRATMLVQATSHFGNALGIYWGDGELVEKPENFAVQSMSIAKGELPLLLWISVKLERYGDGKVSAVTRGLDRFGLMNVEIQHEALEAAYAYEFVGDIAFYLVRNGPIVRDGDTVGESNDQRIKVRFAPSIVEPEKQVYVLDF